MGVKNPQKKSIGVRKMGDRVSIEFVNGKEHSVVLFSHWGGMDFVKDAEEYVKELRAEVKGNHVNPLQRLEPNTVMVDLIRYLTKDLKRVESDLYLGAEECSGDNSDNGHHIIRLDE